MEPMMCCPLDGGDERPTFYRVEKPTARAARKCTECGDAIAKGVLYERITGKWDHDKKPQVFSTCLSCVEIRDHFACGRGWMFGEVWEQLEESFFPDMKAGGPCMKGLSPTAKARLFELRLKWLGDR